MQAALRLKSLKQLPSHAAGATEMGRAGVRLNSRGNGFVLDGVEDDETREFRLVKLGRTYPYAIFAMESPEPGRRRSKNHPTPPHARHISGMTVNEGSTPRHAAVCSAMVSGME
mgnify:CR=1 FL=1